MSLLLDALKKAAKEKQQAEKAGYSESFEEATVDSPLNNADELELPILDEMSEQSLSDGEPLDFSESLPQDPIDNLDDKFEELDLDTSSIEELDSEHDEQLEKEQLSDNEDVETIISNAEREENINSSYLIDKEDATAHPIVEDHQHEVAKSSEDARSYSGSENQAQQVFVSKKKSNTTTNIVLLVVLLLLLVSGIAWWAYEQYFSKPAPVAQLNQYNNRLPIVVESENLKEKAIEEESLDLQEALPVKKIEPITQQASNPKTKPLPKQRAKKETLKSQASEPKQRLSIIRTPVENILEKQLKQGYEAYQNGDYGRSRIAYSRALEEDKNNRDALLGLAANAMRKQEPDKAKHYYLRVLALNPQDPAARSGILELQEQRSSGSLAAIKEAIEQQPKSAPLYYSLGNQYAKQSNWGAAQAAYFQAFSLASDHPDYAFNLAISLDRMGKGSTALQYYQRASQLAETKPHSISLSALRQRVEYLKSQQLHAQGANNG